MSELERQFQDLARGQRPKTGDVLVRGDRSWSFLPPNTKAWNDVNEDYQLNRRDSVILVNASAAAIDITLPPAESVAGRFFDIKKIDSSTNAVTIEPDGSETIDGASSLATSVQHESFTIFSDGVEWWIL